MLILHNTNTNTTPTPTQHSYQGGWGSHALCLVRVVSTHLILLVDGVVFIEAAEFVHDWLHCNSFLSFQLNLSAT
jgi:hypothetical protein